ncbi:MAG: rhomboid family intramembrane serine protease [Pedobacter sp.]|nr:rhomboid family intramembrane serine protease [Pedobacter sp.]
MFLTPTDHQFSWKQAPRLVLGLAAVIALIFLFWHTADVARTQELRTSYAQQLLAIEWELYDTHLLKAGQGSTLKRLKAAHAKGDTATLADYMGADDDFVAAVRKQGADYLPPEVLSNWQSARRDFDAQHRLLSAEALGVDPQHFRPITFLTFNLTQPGLVQFLGALLLLLTAGMALEIALGSGAVLAAFLGGGIAGAIVYLIANGAGVLPLAGAGAGIGGVVGMFLMHFRTQKLKFFGAAELPALIIAVLWLLWLTAEYFVDGLRVAELAAQLAGIASGPLSYVLYQRWFAGNKEEVAALPEASAEELDQAYREQLQQALDTIAALDFVTAQKRLRELVKSRPQDLRVLEQLYHVEKLQPTSTTFDAVARRFFVLATQGESGGHRALAIYRDYDKASLDKKALDTEVCLKLVIRFSRLGEIKDAEKIIKTVLARKVSHPLLAKAAHALSQACEQLQDSARAEQYRELAKQG